MWVNRQGIRAKPRKVRPGLLPAVEYEADEIVRRVPGDEGLYPLWRAALESAADVPRRTGGDPTVTSDGCYGMFFTSHQIATIDLRQPAG